MKFLLCSSFLLLLTFTQSSSSFIIGKWMYEGTLDNQNQVSCCVDCPDLFEFNKDGSYTVRNDCYGINLMKPIVETGKWKLDLSSKQLFLTARRFTTNYTPYSSNKAIVLTLVQLSRDKLNLSFQKGKTKQYIKDQ